MTINEINVFKANVHNLNSVDVSIPKNTLTVITGPSGSGKSSLAFDTIYVEGQRRYIESLSSYARQFLGQFQPPDVESISGLSPAIAIDQKTTSKNPRSTVGTVTEIFDYLRVLFARVGTMYCPDSGKEIKSYTIPQITKEILKHKEKTKIYIISKIQLKTKKSIKNEIDKFLSMGFTRAYINKEIINLDEIKPTKVKIDDFNLIVDRLVVKEGINKRVNDSVELATKLGAGQCSILINEKKLISYSEKNISPVTGENLPDLEPRLFSFNSPLGACPKCNGLGEIKYFNEDYMILDEGLSINNGAITPLSKNNFLLKMVQSVAKAEKIDLDLPLKKLPKSFYNILFNGSEKVYAYSFNSENSTFEFKKSFPGITKWLDKKFMETSSEKTRKNLESFMTIQNCPECEGLRLNKAALSTKIGNFNIMELCQFSIDKLNQTFQEINFESEKKTVAEKLLKEIRSRLQFLVDVGIGYLNLNRGAMTLSGGEAQRIRLATQIGSALSGVLYVLDEPSIGLHQRDNDKLIDTLKSLRDLGNTVLVVEHDEDTIEAADYIIDMGPGAGVHGGNVVGTGKPIEIKKNSKSITGEYLNGKKLIKIPAERRTTNTFIKLKGAIEHNLQKINIDFPKNTLTCITGVSGSGKSTLVHKILVPAVRYNLANKNKQLYKRNNYQSITGLDEIKSVIELDQSPIGRTPHSNPATYTGLFDEIRKLYSMLPESQIRGYKAGRFSFNVKGGRCENCEGNGVKKIEMHFLPDVYITCDECSGSRYNQDTLSILYKGKNIADILKMTIEEGLDFFKNHKKMNRILSTLNNVGLGYMTLGQPATTLSGGEAQRLKLSRELAKSTKGHCLYILDEPTTGLHFSDINILLKAIQDLVEKGNSVIVIEHNLDVIKTADYIIDLGPEGGINGGQIVATGTPEEISKNKKSITGQYIKKVLKK